MADIVLSEQLVIFGSVDIPMSNDNTLKLLQVFGGKGYVPSVMQEVNIQDGRTLNRISLIDTVSVSINFNSDRIHLIRAHNPAVGIPSRPFVELAIELVEGLSSSFTLKSNRCVLAVEKLMADDRPDKIRAVRLSHMIDEGGVEPFEWFLRTAEIVESSSQPSLRILEVARMQGNILHEGQMTNFDKVRYKSEIGTDMRNLENRFSLMDLVPIIHGFHEEQKVIVADWELKYHEA